MKIRLVEPTLEHEKKALEFKQEFFDNNETVIDGSELLDKTDSYKEWLQSVTNNARRAASDPDRVLTDTFFAMDEDDAIVGIIDLRYELKGSLIDFGNTGYSVRPSQRRKGYATEMLRLIKEKAAQSGLSTLQLAAERTNYPSVKTILNNGGVFIRSFVFQNGQADVYTIDL